MAFTTLPKVSLETPLPVTEGGTGSTSALSNNRVLVSSGGAIVEASAITGSMSVVSNSSGIPVASTISSAQLLSVPYWTKYTKTYTDLSTAGLTNDIELFSLPAKTVIHKTVVKHSVAFSGSTIASYTISVGIAGTLAKFIAAFDVFQAVAATTFSSAATTINQSPENFTSAVSVRIAAVAVGANLSAATAGSVDMWIETSLLP